MLTTRDLLAGVLLPALLAAVTLTIAARLTRRRLGHRDSRTFAGPLAIGLGFAGGWLALFGPEGFPPLDATDWLLWLAIPLALLGSEQAWWRVLPVARLASAVVAVTATLWLLGAPLVAADSPERGATSVTLLFAGLLLVGLDRGDGSIGAAGYRAARLEMILLVAALAAAWALGHSGSQWLAQLAAMLAAGQLGVLACSLWLAPAGSGPDVALVFGVLYGGVLACGHLYSELPAEVALGLFIAPCAAWIVEPFAKARHWPAWRTSAIQVALVASIGGGIVWIVMR